MKILELGSGTGTVSKVAKSRGHSTVSLDLKNSNIDTDILEWNYTILKRKKLMLLGISSSPPCTEYTIAKTAGFRNIDCANSIALFSELLLESLTIYSKICHS